ncbi:AraC family transcriptional regulator [Sphingobacterium sp. lm-10]|uniref:AraC family transcriptional regulator n=1 Tax=Sphingobacterium sp. lm-10 TaxID=2944904 RepID=UPI0020214BAB|nr:AraC family transcriptional regulator [Sphingobacterium sp. lm-10]MCL7988469.1 AraC family transcriptional regulator [Sphingobacterium sp. lm-10]
MGKNQQRAVQDFFYLDEIWKGSNSNNTCTEKSLHNEVGDFKTIYIHESKSVAIREYHSLYRKDCKLASTMGESSYIEMSFFLHSHTIKDNIAGQPREYLPYHGYVYFVPKGAAIKVVLEKNKNYRHLDMYLELGHFTEWIATHSFVRKFVNDVTAGRTAHLFPKGIPICPEIANLLLEIKSSELDEISREYYIKGKIFLLLSLLFQKAQSSTSPTPKGSVVFRQDEQDKLQRIADLLEKNLDKFYSIEFLAKEYALNEFKLKKGFKQFYGMGIFEYAVKLKMEQARKLITDNNHTFKEVAYLLGYSAPSSFSVAFKRATGLSPLQYRKGLTEKHKSHAMS